MTSSKTTMDTLEHILYRIKDRKKISVTIDLSLSAEIEDCLYDFDSIIIDKIMDVQLVECFLIQLICGENFNDYIIAELCLTNDNAIEIGLVYKNKEAELLDENNCLYLDIIRRNVQDY